ncbi:MAG: rhodanese-like domain-containing protein [Chlamydiales bacterium]
MRTAKLIEVQRALKKERSNIVLINVLPSDLFEKEHIPNSINIPSQRPDFVEQVKSEVVDKDTPIILYCSSPRSSLSKQAVIKLEKEGFTNVIHFKGGMEEWRNSGEKVEQRG